MGTSAPLTIALVTPPLSRAEVFAEDFTIRSIFSVKFSVAAVELAAEFLKRFSVVSPGGAKIDNVVRTYVTTCKSRSKKRLSAQKRKSKFGSWMSVINVGAPGASRDHVGLIALFAAAVVR